MFVITYTTESGDEGILGVWKDMPTLAQVEAKGRESHPSAYEDTDIPYISFTAYEVSGPLL